MIDNFKIGQLKLHLDEISRLSEEAFSTVSTSTTPIHAKFNIGGIESIANKVLNKAFRAISIDLARVKTIETEFDSMPTANASQELLHISRSLLAKKHNSDAVRILTKLVNIKLEEATLTLGTVFSHGVKNRLGKIEFKHPRNAEKCLTIGVQCGNIMAGYLLGTLYRTHGQLEAAKEIFLKNTGRGCAKSRAEVIFILQKEALSTDDARERAIIEHRINNLRSDFLYK